MVSKMSFEKTFGLSSVFIESTRIENGGVPESVSAVKIIKEAIHVIGCCYEDKTDWGKEVHAIAFHFTSKLYSISPELILSTHLSSLYVYGQIGWMYGSITDDILTGFKMHCRGWRSIYSMPSRPAFRGSTPANLSDRLHQDLRLALGSIQIFLSRHCPLWYGFREGRLHWLQRLAYVHNIVYPFTSFPLVVYCLIPAICLLTGQFIVPSVSTH